MARHDPLLHSAAYSDVAETRTPIDALIRTGLGRAFPLPAKGQDIDETFRLLLDALARRHGGNRQSSASFAGHKS
jgi:hypothetical protein